MGWFNRIKEGITTSTKDKKETPEGLWFKCPQCNNLTSSEDHHNNFCVCSCGYHERIGSDEYFKILFDNGKSHRYTEIDKSIGPADPLNFVDHKKYKDRIIDSQKK